MQNVACPITIVSNENRTPPNAKNEFSAIPVMMPGSAIGSTRTNDTTSRPKNRKRCTANAASEPSTRATAVATSAARTDSQSACRIASLCQADENHRVDNPESGQLCTFDGLNA